LPSKRGTAKKTISRLREKFAGGKKNWDGVGLTKKRLKKFVAIG